MAVAFAEISDETDHVSVADVEDELLVALNDSGVFRLVDRGHLEEIMAEQHFTYSSLVAPDRIKRLGVAAGVDAFLYCRVTDCSENHGGLATDCYTTGRLRLVDVATSSVLWCRTVQGWDLEAVRESLSAAGAKLPVGSQFAESSEEALARLTAETLANQLSNRASSVVGVWDITRADEADIDTAELSLLLEERLSDLTAFRTVDRASLSALMAEQNLAMEGITSPDERSKWGRLYSMDVLLFGTVREGFNGDVELTLTASDVQSHEVLWAGRVAARATAPDTLAHKRSLSLEKRLSHVPDRPFEMRKPLPWKGSDGELAGGAALCAVTTALALSAASAEGTIWQPIGIGVSIPAAIGTLTFLAIFVNQGTTRSHNANVDRRNSELTAELARLNSEIESRNQTIVAQNRLVDAENASTRSANALLRNLRPRD